MQPGRMRPGMNGPLSHFSLSIQKPKIGVAHPLSIFYCHAEVCGECSSLDSLLKSVLFMSVLLGRILGIYKSAIEYFLDSL
ncbi:hypothetical protein JTE90_003006 [Oedothorax gibbosus]|uniref:Uncharacterized protein n=1 Tax=Oedothorax gibbosus TaxID=931172 RepID=A0AAV6VDF9_9ARAC|nr:hypothetical protein JTE90_003006 [Oedothorax gibbosus]